MSLNSTFKRSSTNPSHKKNMTSKSSIRLESSTASYSANAHVRPVFGRSSRTKSYADFDKLRTHQNINNKAHGVNPSHSRSKSTSSLSPSPAVQADQNADQVTNKRYQNFKDICEDCKHLLLLYTSTVASSGSRLDSVHTGLQFQSLLTRFAQWEAHLDPNEWQILLESQSQRVVSGVVIDLLLSTAFAIIRTCPNHLLDVAAVNMVRQALESRCYRLRSENSRLSGRATKDEGLELRTSGDAKSILLKIKAARECIETLEQSIQVLQGIVANHIRATQTTSSDGTKYASSSKKRLPVTNARENAGKVRKKVHYDDDFELKASVTPTKRRKSHFTGPSDLSRTSATSPEVSNPRFASTAKRDVAVAEAMIEESTIQHHKTFTKLQQYWRTSAEPRQEYVDGLMQQVPPVASVLVTTKRSEILSKGRIVASATQANVDKNETNSGDEGIKVISQMLENLHLKGSRTARRRQAAFTIAQNLVKEIWKQYIQANSKLISESMGDSLKLRIMIESCLYLLESLPLWHFYTPATHINYVTALLPGIELALLDILFECFNFILISSAAGPHSPEHRGSAIIYSAVDVIHYLTRLKSIGVVRELEAWWQLCQTSLKDVPTKNHNSPSAIAASPIHILFRFPSPKEGLRGAINDSKELVELTFMVSSARHNEAFKVYEAHEKGQGFNDL